LRACDQKTSSFLPGPTTRSDQSQSLTIDPAENHDFILLGGIVNGTGSQSRKPRGFLEKTCALRTLVRHLIPRDRLVMKM
jgi:hypothetical protein